MRISRPYELRIQALVSNPGKKQLKYKEAIDIVTGKSCELAAAVRRIYALSRIIWKLKFHNERANTQ